MTPPKHSFFLIAAITAALWVAGCSAPPIDPATTPESATAPESEGAPEAGLANPASVHCEENGGQLEIRTDPAGGQYGVCIFPDGSECEEWAFFRGECQPGQEPQDISQQPPPRYINEEYGFSLDPPSDWRIESFADYLLLHRTDPDGNEYALFVGFQRADDELHPFRSGMGAGEIIDSGMVDFMGGQVPKKMLVLEGRTKTVLYGSYLEADGLLLSIFLDPKEMQGTDWSMWNIPPSIIAEADQIVSSFALYP